MRNCGRRVCGPLARQKQHPHAFWRGWRRLALDGTQCSGSNTPQMTGAFAKTASRRWCAAFAKLGAGGAAGGRACTIRWRSGARVNRNGCWQHAARGRGARSARATPAPALAAGARDPGGIAVVDRPAGSENGAGPRNGHRVGAALAARIVLPADESRAARLAPARRATSPGRVHPPSNSSHQNVETQKGIRAGNGNSADAKMTHHSQRPSYGLNRTWRSTLSTQFQFGRVMFTLAGRRLSGNFWQNQKHLLRL